MGANMEIHYYINWLSISFYWAGPFYNPKENSCLAKFYKHQARTSNLHIAFSHWIISS